MLRVTQSLLATLFLIAFSATTVLAFTIPYARIIIDNNYDDWDEVPNFDEDITGDIYESLYFDIKRVQITQDGTYYYVRFEMASDYMSTTFSCPNKPWGEIGIYLHNPGRPWAIFGAYLHFNRIEFPPEPFLSLVQFDESGPPGETLMSYSYSSGYVRLMGANIEFKFPISKIPFDVVGKDLVPRTYDHCLAISDSGDTRYITAVETPPDRNVVIVPYSLLLSNKEYFDCNGDLGGAAYQDNCGTCDSDPNNDCIQDCNGTWGGSAVVDECGVCGGDGSTCSTTCHCECYCSSCSSTITCGGSGGCGDCTTLCIDSCNSNPACGNYVSSDRICE